MTPELERRLEAVLAEAERRGAIDPDEVAHEVDFRRVKLVDGVAQGAISAVDEIHRKRPSLFRPETPADPPPLFPTPRPRPKSLDAQRIQMLRADQKQNRYLMF